MARQSVAGEDHISAALLPQSQVPEPRPPSLRPRDPEPSPPPSDPGSQSQSLPQTQESRAQPSSPRPKSPETNPPFPGPGVQTPALLPQGQRPDSIPPSGTGIQVLPLLPDTQGPVDLCPPPLDPGDPPHPCPAQTQESEGRVQPSSFRPRILNPSPPFSDPGSMLQPFSLGTEISGSSLPPSEVWGLGR